MIQSARFDYVQIVFDDDDRIAQIDQSAQDGEQFFGVVEVQAGGGLVEDVQGFAGVDPAQFGGQFDALRLAAGKRVRRLAQRHVSQAHFLRGC